MNARRNPLLILAALLCVLLGACQQQLVTGSSLGLRDYPDSVVHINQVDPAYRGYFAEQHGSSFSLSDQREAFSKARQTARTPVTESAYRPAKATPRKSSARGKKSTARGKKSTSRSKSSSGKKKASSGKKSSSAKKTSSKKKSSSKRRR